MVERFDEPVLDKLPSAYLVQQKSKLPSPDCMQVVFSFFGYHNEVLATLSQLYCNGKTLYHNRVKNYLAVA